jgi:glyoxylase-like metal-dependent hydrolase (beta-lactamase superfamily II)
MHLRYAWILPLLLLAGLAWALTKAAPLRGDWVPEEVAPGVFVIHGPTELPNPQNQGFMNNPAFIVADGGVVVVDPGGSVQVGEMLLQRIADVTDKPVVAVFNSHVHGDHWLGNQAIRERYPDVPIYGHARVGPQILAGAGTEWVEMMLRMTENATAGTRIVPPDRAVNDGDVISVAGLTIDVMHIDRAHTNTDVMLLVRERGVLFLGDNGSHGRILRLDGGSFPGNIEALERALASGAEVFVPGHGRSGGAEVAQSYRDYLATVYRAAERGVDEGLADFEVRPQLVPQLEPWSQWSGFDFELGGHISGAYLEAEAAAF